MKQPLVKRRRVSSNTPPLFSPSDTQLASPKSSKFLTCMSCHRTVGLKSNPAFLCKRCSAPTCVICLRTCAGGPEGSPPCAVPVSPPPDSATLTLSDSKTNTSSSRRRRRPRDEDSDNVKQSGCGQVVCRMCCFEHPQSGVIACLDCSAKQHVLPTHESDASMHGALNPDHRLIA